MYIPIYMIYIYVYIYIYREGYFVSIRLFSRGQRRWLFPGAQSDKKESCQLNWQQKFWFLQISCQPKWQFFFFFRGVTRQREIGKKFTSLVSAARSHRVFRIFPLKQFSGLQNAYMYIYVCDLSKMMVIYICIYL